MPTGTDASAGELAGRDAARGHRRHGGRREPRDPSDTADPLQPPDYANISNELDAFLTDPERGIEQFYAIVRNATEPDE